MKISENGKLLRIFIGEADRYENKPLFEAIILKARELGLAGATVIRGIEGFGAASRVIHTAHILRLSEDLPIVVEIVDAEEKINSAIKHINEIIEHSGCGVLVTMESVQVLKYSSNKK